MQISSRLFGHEWGGEEEEGNTTVTILDDRFIGGNGYRIVAATCRTNTIVKNPLNSVKRE